jgi:hypothetical protein
MAQPSNARNSAGRFTSFRGGIRGHVHLDGRSTTVAEQVIATEDKIVHDDLLNIDRKVFAGQPVPPELVDAYNGDTRASDGSDPDGSAVDYESQSAEQLEAEAKQRGIYDDIEGTGANGNVVKADLVKALSA